MVDLTEEFRDKIRAGDKLSRIYVDPDWGEDIICVELPEEVRGAGKGEQRLMFLEDYAREHFFHPDVWGSVVDGMNRWDTYRSSRHAFDPKGNVRGADGKYTPKPEYLRADGEKYFATKHIDYKAITGHILRHEDGRLEVRIIPGDPYPHINMFVHVPNPANAPWTTYGTIGENAAYAHRTGDGRLLRPDMYGFIEVDPDSQWGTNKVGRAPVPAAIQTDKDAAFMDDVKPYVSAETVEVDEEEYSRLLAIEAQYDAAFDKLKKFCGEYGVKDPRKAAEMATTEELRKWLMTAIRAAGLWDAHAKIALELADRVIKMESRTITPREEI